MLSDGITIKPSVSGFVVSVASAAADVICASHKEAGSSLRDSTSSTEVSAPCSSATQHTVVESDGLTSSAAPASRPYCKATQQSALFAPAILLLPPVVTHGRDIYSPNRSAMALQASIWHTAKCSTAEVWQCSNPSSHKATQRFLQVLTVPKGHLTALPGPDEMSLLTSINNEVRANT